MLKISCAALLLIAMIAPVAAAVPAVTVPAPDIGEGVAGMLLAAGAVYLVKRRVR